MVKQKFRMGLRLLDWASVSLEGSRIPGSPRPGPLMSPTFSHMGAVRESAPSRHWWSRCVTTSPTANQCISPTSPCVLKGASAACTGEEPRAWIPVFEKEPQEPQLGSIRKDLLSDTVFQDHVPSGMAGGEAGGAADSCRVLPGLEEASSRGAHL